MRSRSDATTLFEIARQAMIDRDFLPDFDDEVRRQVAVLAPEPPLDSSAKDLRSLPWCSIDNDDTRDIDQLSVADASEDGSIRLRVAVADVDWLVPVDSPVDRRAAHNTTTVYTPVHNFLMIPAELCTDRTSLNEETDRMALVIEMLVTESGEIASESVYSASVRNHLKLAYDAVSEWLDGTGDLAALDGRDDVAGSIRLQDEAAERLYLHRHQLGALELQTIEPNAVLRKEEVVDLAEQPKNRARRLIENLMIAVNGVTTRFLERRGLPTFRRVVREPRRWDRIMAIAEERGEKLPPEPSSKALDEFLALERDRDPVGFPDLSLTIVKLIGSGEYAVEIPGEEEIGHFGLAVQDYSHSTAPNRRFPDLITHRLLKSALLAEEPVYTLPELEALAERCSEMEDEAKKVERRVRKSAAALLLRRQIGQQFEGIVTGASSKGTWVRVFRPPVEGKLVKGEAGLDVGDRIRVKLVNVDVDRGYIDFVRI